MRTGLKIQYRNPAEVGSDRIADAIAAVDLFPGQDLIVVDFGTATTIEAIRKDGTYMGGMILPGIRLAMEALESKTAKLQVFLITLSLIFYFEDFCWHCR